MNMKINIKSRRKIILKSIILLLIFYVAFLFLNLFVKIKDKKQEIQNLNEQISVEKGKTQEILDKLDGKNDGTEKVEQGEEDSHTPGVRVYENVVR